MGVDLWFATVLDIGYSSPDATGRPISLLINYTICAKFDLTDATIQKLRRQPWTEEVRRCGRGRRRLQLIVRYEDWPSQFKEINSQDLFRAEILRIVMSY